MTAAHPFLGVAMASFAGGGNVAGGYLVTRALPGTGQSNGSIRQQAILGGLTQIGAGVLIAVALLEFVPTALQTLHPQSWAAAAILFGYLIVHLVEHTVVPHFHGKSGASTPGGSAGREVTAATAYSVVAGLIVHSFFDGVAIAAAVLLSPTLGWLIFAAILMHKTPVGATIASVALSAGLTKRVAVFLASLVGAASVVGALIVRPLGQAQIGLAISLGAGVMLYVAATELIPAGEGQKKGYASACVLVGVLLFVATDYFIRKVGLQ